MSINHEGPAVDSKEVIKTEVEKVENGTSNPEGAKAEVLNTINSEYEKSLGGNIEYSGTEGEDQAELDSVVADSNKEIEQAKAEALKKIDEVEKKESKEGFSEGHIMNPKMLDKIAQLEAISPDTGLFDQARYDDYMNGQAKLGEYSVGENQKKTQARIDSGRRPDYHRLQVVYGQGGWNRYKANDTGEVFLSRGASNTTGSPEYKAALAKKAQELGIGVEGV